MSISKPAARSAQAPHDDQDEIKSAKQHTRAVFAWLDGLAADAELPSSAFRAVRTAAEAHRRPFVSLSILILILLRTDPLAVVVVVAAIVALVAIGTVPRQPTMSVVQTRREAVFRGYQDRF
jgi:hypothetical protein